MPRPRFEDALLLATGQQLAWERSPSLCDRPTMASTSGTFRLIEPLFSPLHLQRGRADILGRGAVRQQLEVLEDAGRCSRAEHRHLAPLEAREGRRPPTTILPSERVELL